MKNRIVNFSDIYSPRNKDLIKTRSLSPSLSKSQKISPNTLTIKNFFQRPKESISNLPNIDNYRGQTKLTFTEERAAQINKRLEIDSIIQKSFEKRIKSNQMYVNPNNNPFTRFLYPSSQTLDAKTKVNVVSEVNKLMQPISASTMKKRVGRDPTPIQEYFIDEELLKAKIKQRDRSNQRRMAFETQQEVPDDVQMQSQISKFEELINIRQESFFTMQRRQKSWNIFGIISNKNHQDFKSNKQILTKFHFSRDSIFNVHTTQQKKYENNSLVQISSFSRQVIFIPQKKIKNLPQRFMFIPGDMRVTVQKLEFQDLMPIANGRLTQQVLMRYFREQDLSGKSKAQQQEDANKRLRQQAGIVYKENTQNYAANCGNEFQDRAEIDTYVHHIKKAPIQAQQQILSNTLKQRYIKLSKKEMESLRHTVRDRQLLQKMQKQKNKILLKQLETNVDARIRILMKQVDRKIRINKVSKNRTEKLKINILTQTLKFRRNMESISPRKNLGKSAVLTWR